MSQQSEDELLRSAIRAATRAAETTAEFKSETFLAVLLAALLNPRPAPSPVTAIVRLPQPELPGTAKVYSPGEFFASRNWSTEVDKVILAGSFLERYSSLGAYSVQQIRSCLTSAKITPPKNVNLAVFQAVQRGWMMEVQREKDPTKVWALTQTGEKKVEEMSREARQ